MRHFRPSLFLITSLCFLLASCKYRSCDLLLINGVIHTVNPTGDVVQALAIKDGKIVGIGNSDDLKFDFKADSIVDLKGKTVFPGFVDPHCHFLGYARNLDRVNLIATTSFDEVLYVVEQFGKKTNSEWIVGRGWDQNKWKEKEFPTNAKLNALFPDRPVLLRRIDGHAALANDEALRRAGVTTSTKIKGGILKKRGGRLTGVLIDNAVDLVADKIPPLSNEQLTKLILRAQTRLFADGLTSIHEAGLHKEEILLLDSLHKAGLLRLRIYAMANPTDANKEWLITNGPYKTDYLNVRSFKIYADGALGSRGACLLRPYKDAPGQYGLILQNEAYFKEWAKTCYDAGFQMNSHCIGDSANRMMLRIYGDVLKGENDRRWRIEHAQIVNPNDFSKFKKFSVWPSVQPTHAISDMLWAEDRIGKQRLRGAYAYKSLFSQFDKIAFGSDFPVESTNPLLGFHAAVARVDLTGYPYGGFQIQEAVGRDTALKAMTIWAAEAGFEEKERGSLEEGKDADFVVLDKDLMFVPLKSVPYIQIEMTYVNGKQVYKMGDPIE